MTAKKPDLVAEDLSVDFAPWGRIHVHNVRPANVDRFEPGRIAIFQHGATYGSLAFSMASSTVSPMAVQPGRSGK